MLLSEWENEHDSLGLSAANQRYEQAIQSLPDTFSAAEKESASQALANRYLSRDEQQAIQARQQVTRDQQAQVKDYQHGLHTLEQQLATLKNTLPADEWQQHSEEQHEQYRRTFFAQ